MSSTTAGATTTTSSSAAATTSPVVTTSTAATTTTAAPTSTPTPEHLAAWCKVEDQKDCNTPAVEETGHSLYTCQALALEHSADSVAWSQNTQQCQVFNFSECTLGNTAQLLTYWTVGKAQEIWSVYTQAAGAGPCGSTFRPDVDDSTTCPAGTCDRLSSYFDSWDCDDVSEYYEHSCDFMRLFAECNSCGSCTCEKTHDEELRGAPYGVREWVGNCNLAGQKHLHSLEECELAARALGVPDTSAHDMPQGYSRYPYGCYFKPLNGNLYWNSYGNFEVEYSPRYSLCYLEHYVDDFPGALEYYGTEFQSFRGGLR